jgi:hypothetical protein
MSVREFPAEDSSTRQERAEQIQITDIREIEGDTFGADVTVYEIDAVNEDGETRENVTIVPEMLFENTKDVQHRHEYGIVGKYSRALALEDEQAKELLLGGIRNKRDSVLEQVRSLKEKDSRLLHTQADLGGL